LLDSLLQENNFIMEDYRTRKCFDPVEHGLNKNFRLTNFTKLKG